jgi:hypothetical protein
MVWLLEKTVSGVLRFGLEASERLMNVGSIRTVAVMVYSQMTCSFGRKSAKPLRLPNVSRGGAGRCPMSIGLGMDFGATAGPRSALQS